VTATAHHPRHELDTVIHAPVRFSIMATLSSMDSAEFAFVRDIVEISDSALSKQASVLEQAGYVKIKKGYVGKRPRTWLSLTPAGRRTYTAHVAPGHGSPKRLRRRRAQALVKDVWPEQFQPIDLSTAAF
jgi:DNA-binding MarR family transcriptional regulator